MVRSLLFYCFSSCRIGETSDSFLLLMIDTLFLYVLVHAKGWGAANHLAVWKKYYQRRNDDEEKSIIGRCSIAGTYWVEWSCGSRSGLHAESCRRYGAEDGNDRNRNTCDGDGGHR